MPRLFLSLLVPLSFLFSLTSAVPATAQVEIIEQFADMEASAGARCPGEEAPEPDFQKRWLTDLDGVDESPLAEMSSPCSHAWFRTELAIDFLAQEIQGDFSAWSSTDGLAGGHASLWSYLRLRVESPTHYLLVTDGEFAETGDPHVGSHFLHFEGVGIDHDTRDAVSWHEQWEGTLQPGEEYLLTLVAVSERAGRELPGGEVLTQDGETQQNASFTLQFDAAVVGTETESWGTLKASY